VERLDIVPIHWVSVIVSTDRTDNWVISRLLSVSIFRTVETSSRRLCQHSSCWFCTNEKMAE